MTLTARQPMRPCGKRYRTEEEALHSKLGLTGRYGAVPCRCLGYHLVPLTQAATAALQSRDTGPDRETRMAVYERDGWACVCCGTPVRNRPHSVGHRKRRSQGGTLQLSNLLTFLGWGDGRTADDHHWRIDRRDDPHDEARGYSLRRSQNPLLVPVMYFSPEGSGALMYLDNEGGISPDAPIGGEVA